MPRSGLVEPFPMESNQTVLELPEVPGRILDEVLPFVLKFLPTDRILLGGGTALAARWRHRESFDVDLFVDPVTYHRYIYRRSRQCEDWLVKLDLGRFAAVGEEGCSICCEDGQVDIVACFPISADCCSQDRVAGGRIGLESNVEILAKKLHRRILSQGQIVPRDLYDMAYARRFEPETMQAAWTARRVVDADAMIAALSSFSRGWMGRQEETVQGARYPELEVNAVEGMLEDVRHRFQGRLQGPWS